MGLTDTVGGIAGGFMPNFAMFSSIFHFMTWILIFIIFLVVVGVTTFILVYFKKFNKKIVLFEKINGIFQPVGKDRAMEVKLSTSGDTILYLAKAKKYLPNPSIQTGIRTYWYFVREDDEWINFGLDDLDLTSKRMGAKMLQKEARFARTQIQKGLKERYDKPGFWEKYGLLVMSLGYIVIIGVMTWLIMDKWIEVVGNIAGIVENLDKVIEKADSILGKLDNLNSGGSGLIR